MISFYYVSHYGTGQSVDWEKRDINMTSKQTDGGNRSSAPAQLIMNFLDDLLNADFDILFFTVVLF